MKRFEIVRENIIIIVNLITGTGQKKWDFLSESHLFPFHFYFTEVKFTNDFPRNKNTTLKKVKHVRKFKSIITPQFVKFKVTIERNK